MDRKAWLENIGRIIDSMDAEGFAALMTENGTFRFGNMPPVVGRANIAETVRQFWSMIKNSENHEVIDFWEKPGSVVWQGSVLYTRMDGRQVKVQFTNIFHLDGDLIQDYLIYIDNGPLWEA